MTYDQFFIATVSLTIAGFIVYAVRHWLKPRNKGEGLSEFAQRIDADRQAYREAKRELTNSRIKIANALFSNAMLIGLMWLMAHAPNGRWIALGYVAVGAALATSLLARPTGWAILTFLDRLLWRIEHAWFWPLLVLRNIRNLKEV